MINGEHCLAKLLLKTVKFGQIDLLPPMFDEMAARSQVLNFEKIFGGFARLVLVSLQMLGF